jgi:endoglucanase
MKRFAIVSAVVVVVALLGVSCKPTPAPTPEPLPLPEPPSEEVDVPAPDPTGMDDDAVAMAAGMGLGWNLGNTLEPPDGEGTWNNPRVTHELIKTVAEAGFSTIRIPCAWDSHIINRTTYEIDPAWLNRVAEVVGWCLDEGLYVMLNTHWDGGWLEENPYYAKQEAVNTQLAALWKQIATKMRDFDQRLLFAGTNEVHHGYDAPKAENIAVQQSFNQTFVDAVRGTGGRNVYRNLVVQAYNTNIDYAVQYFTLPRDAATGRLMLEVHNYDPWEFTIMGSDDPGVKLVWGNRPEAPVQGDDPRKPSWGDEDFADAHLAKMKTNFVDKGIPVIVGEYGGTFRTGLGDNQADHDASNVYYMGYMTRAMVANGLVPVYWDNGAVSGGSGLFDRRTYETVHRDVLDAIIGR